MSLYKLLDLSGLNSSVIKEGYFLGWLLLVAGYREINSTWLKRLFGCSYNRSLGVVLLGDLVVLCFSLIVSSFTSRVGVERAEAFAGFLLLQTQSKSRGLLSIAEAQPRPCV